MYDIYIYIYAEKIGSILEQYVDPKLRTGSAVFLTIERTCSPAGFHRGHGNAELHRVYGTKTHFSHNNAQIPPLLRLLLRRKLAIYSSGASYICITFLSLHMFAQPSLSSNPKIFRFSSQEKILV